MSLDLGNIITKGGPSSLILFGILLCAPYLEGQTFLFIEPSGTLFTLGVLCITLGVFAYTREIDEKIIQFGIPVIILIILLLWGAGVGMARWARAQPPFQEIVLVGGTVFLIFWFLWIFFTDSER